MPQRTMLSVQAIPDTANIRTAQLFDEDHTIVPCVALVEGVLWPANAPSPELALAEEFGRFPDGWNGRPVVFDHPRVNGEAVSASHPDIMESVAMGSLFNTTVESGKLKTEIWINEDRVKDMDEDVQDAVTRLKDGDEVVEVSTGLFTMSEAAEGTFNGEEFSAIWRNIVPDHLAVLPEGITGACSVEDGCGAPRSNERFIPVMNSSTLIEFKNSSGTTINTDCQCSDPDACECGEKKGTFQKIMEKAGDLFSFRDQSAGLSDADTRTAIQGALATNESFFWILAIFDEGDGNGVVVFESFDAGKLFEQEFNISDDGSVSLGASKTEVRPVTQFVAVNPEEESETEVTDNSEGDTETETQDGSIQENEMNIDQLVQGLIDNESSQFTEDDRDWLSTLEESQLAKMSPTVIGGDGDEEEEKEVFPSAAAENAAQPEEQKPVSTEDYIADAPDEVQAVLNSGLKMHRARKEVLVKGILENARNQFTQVQLESKDLGELEGIAALATDISYEGAGMAVTTLADADAVPEPPQLFDLNATKTA